MTIEEFNHLDDFKKLDTVWEHGNRLSVTEDNSYRYIVYQLNDIYVEVKFEKKQPHWPFFRTFKNTIDTSSVMIHTDGMGNPPV
jgi:hypothetical protein